MSTFETVALSDVVSTLNIGFTVDEEVIVDDHVYEKIKNDNVIESAADSQIEGTEFDHVNINIKVNGGNEVDNAVTCNSDFVDVNGVSCASVSENEISKLSSKSEDDLSGVIQSDNGISINGDLSMKEHDIIKSDIGTSVNEQRMQESDNRISFQGKSSVKEQVKCGSDNGTSRNGDPSGIEQVKLQDMCEPDNGTSLNGDPSAIELVKLQEMCEPDNGTSCIGDPSGIEQVKLQEMCEPENGTSFHENPSVTEHEILQSETLRREGHFVKEQVILGSDKETTFNENPPVNEHEIVECETSFNENPAVKKHMIRRSDDGTTFNENLFVKEHETDTLYNENPSFKEQTILASDNGNSFNGNPPVLHETLESETSCNGKPSVKEHVKERGVLESDQGISVTEQMVLDCDNGTLFTGGFNSKEKLLSEPDNEISHKENPSAKISNVENTHSLFGTESLLCGSNSDTDIASNDTIACDILCKSNDEEHNNTISCISSSQKATRSVSSKGNESDSSGEVNIDKENSNVDNGADSSVSTNGYRDDFLCGSSTENAISNTISPPSENGLSNAVNTEICEENKYANDISDERNNLGPINSELSIFDDKNVNNKSIEANDKHALDMTGEDKQQDSQSNVNETVVNNSPVYGAGNNISETTIENLSFAVASEDLSCPSEAYGSMGKIGDFTLDQVDKIERKSKSKTGNDSVVNETTENMLKKLGRNEKETEENVGEGEGGRGVDGDNHHYHQQDHNHHQQHEKEQHENIELSTLKDTCIQDNIHTVASGSVINVDILDTNDLHTIAQSPNTDPTKPADAQLFTEISASDSVAAVSEYFQRNVCKEISNRSDGDTTTQCDTSDDFKNVVTSKEVDMTSSVDVMTGAVNQTSFNVDNFGAITVESFSESSVNEDALGTEQTTVGLDKGTSVRDDTLRRQQMISASDNDNSLNENVSVKEETTALLGADKRFDKVVDETAEGEDVSCKLIVELENAASNNLDVIGNEQGSDEKLENALAIDNKERSPYECDNTKRSPYEVGNTERSSDEGDNTERSQDEANNIERSPDEGDTTERSPVEDDNTERLPDEGDNTKRSQDEANNIERSPDEGDNTKRSQDEDNNTERSSDVGDNTERSPDVGDNTQRSQDKADNIERSPDEANNTERSQDEAYNTEMSPGEGDNTERSQDEANNTGMSPDQSDNTTRSLDEGDNTERSPDQGDIERLPDKANNKESLASEPENKERSLNEAYNTERSVLETDNIELQRAANNIESSPDTADINERSQCTAEGPERSQCTAEGPERSQYTAENIQTSQHPSGNIERSQNVTDDSDTSVLGSDTVGHPADTIQHCGGLLEDSGNLETPSNGDYSSKNQNTGDPNGVWKSVVVQNAKDLIGAQNTNQQVDDLNTKELTGDKSTKDPTGDQSTKEPTGAQSTKDPTGDQSTKEPTGAQSTNDSTGDQSTKDSSGDKSTKEQAGDQSTKDPTGDRSTKEPAGDQSTKEPTGSQSTKDPTGDQSAKEPAGDQSTKDPAGDQSAKEPTGDRSTREPAGDQSTKEPAGDQSTKDPTGDLSTKEPTGDQCTKDPTCDQCTKEPTGDQSSKEPTGDQIAKEPAGDQCTKNPTGDHSTKEPTGDQCTKDPTGDQSTKEPTGDQSTKDPTGDQSTKDPTGDQSTKEPTGDQSTKDPTGDQSTKEPTGDQSTKEPTGDQSTKDPTGDQSTIDATGDQSSKDITGDQSSKDITGDQSSKDITGDQSTKDPTGDQSTIDITGDQSSKDITGDQSSKDITGDQSSKDITGDQSSKDITGDQSSKDITGDQSSKDITGDQSSKDITGDQSSKDITGDQSTKDSAGDQNTIDTTGCLCWPEAETKVHDDTGNNVGEDSNVNMTKDTEAAYAVSNTMKGMEVTVTLENKLDTVGEILGKAHGADNTHGISDNVHGNSGIVHEMPEEYGDNANKNYACGEQEDDKRGMDNVCHVTDEICDVSKAAGNITNMTVEQLQQLLQEQHSAMTRLQSHAHLQQMKANLLTTSLRAKLRRKEQALNLLKSEHEQQISAVLSHLLYLEGHIQKEQKQVLEILHDKDEIIIRQAAEIEKLRSQNNRYREQLKERQGYPPDNGLVMPISHLAHPDEPSLVPDTENRMFLRGSKNKQGEQIYGNGHRVRFSEMKDRLRRHKSSLELYQHDPLETLVESNLKYGSQENLIAAEGNQSKISSRRDKCQSLIDYPMFLRDRADRLTDDGDGQLDDFHSPIISRHDSTSSLVIFDEKTAKQNGTLSTSLAYGFNELSKSKSVPHALSTVSENESVVDSFKMRPKFLPSTAISTKNSLSATATTTTITPTTISASSSMINLSPHRCQTTVSSPTESNPFKSFKNVFKRKGSKKKKPAPSSSSKDQKDAVK